MARKDYSGRNHQADVTAQTGLFTTDLSAGSQRLRQVGDPNADTDATNKTYVDNHLWNFNPGVTQYGGNLDNLKATGIYEITNAASNKPPANGPGWGQLLVMREYYGASGTYCTQLWQTQTITAEIWFRGCVNNTWGPWAEVATKAYTDTMEEVHIAPTQPSPRGSKELWINTTPGAGSVAPGQYLPLTGGYMTGVVNGDGWGFDSGRNGYLLGDYLGASYNSTTQMWNDLDMDYSRVRNLPVPISTGDATNKAYVDARIWFGTQAAYNAIGTKDPTVLYVVTG